MSAPAVSDAGSGSRGTQPYTATPGLRRWLRVGVAAAVVGFASLAVLLALVTPPFRSADEAQHTAYALDVAAGRLPTLATPLTLLLPGRPGQPSRCRPPVRRAGPAPAGAAGCPRHSSLGVTYTANHPPLFYLLEAGPLRAGVAAGHPLAGFRAARLLNVAIGGAGLVAVALLIRLLVPARPDLAVAAAALSGLCGLYVAVSGQVFNDALAVLTITAALAAAVVVLVRGPSRGALVAVCVASLAAAASRASGLETALLIVPAVGAGAFLHSSGSERQRLVRAAGAAGTVVVAVGGGIGWFYLRNISLYGDPTGAGAVLHLFPVTMTRTGVGPSSRRFWWSIYESLWGRPQVFTGVPAAAAIALLAVAPLGIAAAIWRRRARRIHPVPGSLPKAIAWALIAAHVVLVVATLLGYVSSGGAGFARYLLPALPEAALLLAAALAALPFARRGLPTSAAITASALVAIVMIARNRAWHDHTLGRLGTLERLRAALSTAGIGHPDLVLGLTFALLAGAVATVAAALWVLASGPVPRRPATAVGSAPPSAWPAATAGDCPPPALVSAVPPSPRRP